MMYSGHSNQKARKDRWRDCSGWVPVTLTLLILLGSTWFASAWAFQQSASPDLATRIAERRDDRELPPLRHDPALDEIAAQYLREMQDARDIEIVTRLDDIGDLAGTIFAQTNAQSVAGISVGYGPDLESATRHAIDRDASRLALLDTGYETFGSASTVIESDEWLVESPDGAGPPMGLGGYTVLVLITAGAE